MALSATTSPQGMYLERYTSQNEILHVPGDPGDTFTRGDQVVATVGEGVVDLLAANEGGAVGSVIKTVVSPAATQAFPAPGVFDPVDMSTASNCLVPIRPNVPAGVPIYRATFANHWDDTVTSYTASTRALVVGTGMSGNDYPNGALLYVYGGTGAGQVNVVEDYVQSTTTITVHRDFTTALDSTSTIIVLGGEAVASRGVGFFNRLESADEDNLTVNQGSDDGDYVVYMDWSEAADYLKNLTLPVIHARYLMLA